MRTHYSTNIESKTALKAAIVAVLIMVWILIDKGNAVGQIASQAVKQSGMTAHDHSPLLRDGGSRDGIPGEDGEDGTGDFNVYPNPVKDDAVFDFEFTVKTEMPYQISDALGRLIDQGTFVPDVKRQTIDFSQYRTGMYLVSVQMGSKSVVKRVIRQ